MGFLYDAQLAYIYLMLAYDIRSTLKVIGEQGGYEKTPLIAWAIEQFGLVPAVVVSRIALGAAITYGAIRASDVAGGAWYGALALFPVAWFYSRVMMKNMRATR